MKIKTAMVPILMLAVISPNWIFEALQRYPQWIDAFEISVFQVWAVLWFYMLSMAMNNSED